MTDYLQIKNKIKKLKAKNDQICSLEFYAVQAELNKFIIDYNAQKPEFSLSIEAGPYFQLDDNDKKLHIFNFLFEHLNNEQSPQLSIEENLEH